MHFHIPATILTALAALTTAAPLVRRSAATAAKTTPLGYAVDPSFNPYLYRDGGGGGCLADKKLCVIGFSDSFTTSGSGLGAPSIMTGITTSVNKVSTEKQTSFAHNSFATLHLKDADKPTNLVDYGHRNGMQSTLDAGPLGPVTPAESTGPPFAIWPNSNMVPLKAGISASQLVGVANALAITGTTGGKTLYNTMYTVDLSPPADGSNMPVKRIVPQLFQANENLYGTFAVAAGHNDDFLYLFAVTTAGALGASHIKAARVPAAQLADKAAYTYWDGGAWSTTQPAAADTKSAIFASADKLDTGELFWSEHHGAWVLVTSNFGEFRAATAPAITGPWSAPATIYKAEVPADHNDDPVKIIYGGHSYHDWDPSGKSVLLSWTVDENWTQMAVVDWA